MDIETFVDSGIERFAPRTRAAMASISRLRATMTSAPSING